MWETIHWLWSTHQAAHPCKMFLLHLEAMRICKSPQLGWGPWAPPHSTATLRTLVWQRSLTGNTAAVSPVISRRHRPALVSLTSLGLLQSFCLLFSNSPGALVGEDVMSHLWQSTPLTLTLCILISWEFLVTTVHCTAQGNVPGEVWELY